MADGVVERRHVAIVGRPDRPSPVLATRITAVNLNPNWTVPTSIVKADIIPHMRKDAQFLKKNHMRLIGAGGVEIDPKTVQWATLQNPHFFVRQDPGPHNSLGQTRIDMPNAQAVFLHDTPKKELFRNDVRFNSSGCARVDGVRELAALAVEGHRMGEPGGDRRGHRHQRAQGHQARPLRAGGLGLPDGLGGRRRADPFP